MTTPCTSWIVKLRCVVIRELIVKGCDEATARHDYYEHLVYEGDMDTESTEVISVEPNR